MEIEKETRLPFGSKSWWDVLQIIPYQDEIPLKDREPKFKVFMEYNPNNTPWDHSPLPVEHFEADVLTLKVRGFDELKEIIPDKNTLLQMHREARYLSTGNDGTGICKFLEKLINLT